MTISQEQESQIRNKLSVIYGKRAKVQPGSGNQATAPNDVAVINEMHVECKVTEKPSMSIRHDWIEKAELLALQFGTKAFLAIQFYKKNTGRVRNYFIVPDHEFYSMLLLEKQNEEILGANKRLLAEVKRLTAFKEQQKQKREDAYEGQLP